MKRKICCVSMFVLCVITFFVITATAVSIPLVSSSKPIITYTYNSSGKIYAYSASSLKSKTGGYIECAKDECRIIEIKDNAVKVKYPVSNGTKTAWFSREAFTFRNLKSEGAKISFKAKNSVNVYRWKGKTTKLGSISKNDVCYLLRGDEKSDWLQIIYPISGGYKMGWLKNADYKRILPVAESVKLDKTSVVFKKGGATQTIKASVLPNEAIDKKITWKSSNTSVATVSSSGVVTAKSSGSATITATTSNGKKATASVTVKIDIPVNSVVLNRGTVTLTRQGETVSLAATVNPSNATNKTITWSTSNSSVATVSSSGVVTAKANGTATITATTSNGKKATATVTVKIGVPVSSVDLNKSSVTLARIGETVSLTATVNPSNATNKTITWSTSNSSVATVSSSGVVTAKANGTATITAASSNGKTAVAQIKVEDEEGEKEIPVTSIVFDKTSVTLSGVASTAIVTVCVSPSDATDKTIKWKTTDSSVAKIQVSGNKYRFTALKLGTTTYTATTTNGKSATITVKVVPQKATGISLNKNTVTLSGKGKATTLLATVKPDNTTDKSVQWETSNKKVATVSSSGKVKAVDNGTAIITAKTSNGKTATCKIVVSKVKAKSIELNKSSVSLSVGETQNIKATVLPSNSTDEVIWSTSDKKIATVSSSGKITAKKAGSCIVSVKTTSGKTEKVKVTVAVTLTTKEKQVQKKLKKMMEGTSYNGAYKVNIKYKGEYASEQCKGFAKSVHKKLFGFVIGSTKAKPKNYLISYNEKNTKLVGYVTSRKAADLKKLFIQAMPGDFVQMRRSHGGSHSAIIYAVDSNSVTFYEANLDGKNTIYKRTYTWKNLAEKNAAMSLYTAKKY